MSNWESFGGGATSVALNMYRVISSIWSAVRARYNPARSELARQSAVESMRRAQSKFVPACNVRYLYYKQLRRNERVFKFLSAKSGRASDGLLVRKRC